MSNIVNVHFDGEYSKPGYGLVQWDKNQILQIEGLDLPEETEIHFSLNEYHGNAKRVPAVTKDGVTTVAIPAFIVEGSDYIASSYSAYAFIYVTEGESSQTERKIVLNVKTRPKPEDYIHTETEILNYKKLLEEQLEHIAKTNEAIEQNTVQTEKNIEKLAGAVATADSYIGDYQHKELMYELTEEDFLLKTVLLNDVVLQEQTKGVPVWGTPFSGYPAFGEIYRLQVNSEEFIETICENDDTLVFGDVAYCFDGRDFYCEKEKFDTPPSVCLVKVEDSNDDYKSIQTDNVDYFFDKSNGVAFNIEGTFLLNDIEWDFDINEATGILCWNKNVPIEAKNGMFTTEEMTASTTCCDYWYDIYEDVTIAVIKNTTILENYVATRTDGVHSILINTYGKRFKNVRIYKINKNLGSRVAEILDEINGEVV